MIRYAVTFPGQLSDEAMAQIRAQLAIVGNERRVRDVVLQEGGTIARLDTVRVPSVRTKNAQKRLR